jgi:chemotaxis protein methyltransferase CheR
VTAPARAAVDDYERLVTAVRRVCGIDLAQYKRPQMERRIRAFASRRGHDDLGEYAWVLDRDREELDRFLDRLTINVSQLWRNPDQWAVLERRVLPELATAAPVPGRVRCWSAGCSYGAEAYTLAAVCRRAIPDARVTIVGTDIDARMIERAREGVFSADDARDAPADALAAGFDLVDGVWHAREELKQLVRFERADLLRVRPARAAYDLVLCRNTVIYFTEDVRDDVHGRLAASLRAGGRLVVGATERVVDAGRHGLRSESPFVYRKV